MNKSLFAIVALLWFHAFAVGDEPPSLKPLLPNGDLSEFDGDDWPSGWPKGERITLGQDGETRFLRLTSSKPAETVTLYRRVDFLSPAPAGVEVRLRVRSVDVQSGAQKWNDARVVAHFKSADGKTLKPEPPAPSFGGTSDGWIEKAYVAPLPYGAAYFEIMPMLLAPASGSLDVAECHVFAATAERLAAERPPLLASETIVPGAAASLPPALKVDGNRLVTEGEQNVLLQGLCIPSLEWSAKGEQIKKSVPVAIDEWKANAIRLPVRDDFWFGRGAYQGKDGGAAYRKIVDAAVEATASRGAYLILDLHRFGTPKREHVEFWQDAAVRYRNHPAVLFELFNEPHGTSWEVWRNGGPLTDEAGAPTGEVGVGMQALLDSVRATGAQNVVVAGGLDWSYDLSGVVNGFALEERDGGRGIVYSAHIYPWKRDWQGKVLAAAEKHPIFVGEVGTPPDWKSVDFIPQAARAEDLSTGAWPRDVLGMMQAEGLHWTAFSFHPKATPVVISDWEYSPTAYWGKFVKEALSGRRFEAERMR